ncbi:GNAT family N-acetyltransferase [Demequina litorisediminis]|uniref:GNAT family N-acetyltransferase n=1 Tax=Demequina litorisediminis TaxID=1849022 RepID=UPI0024E15B65|nr:GNAT family N-acetyltransferase [Demequina litorisediminis]
MIRPATLADADRIAAIYNPYVTDTVITFETETVTAKDIAARMKSVWDKDLPYLVIEQEGRVVGFAYAAPYRPKAAYLHSVETTIYLDGEAGGKGLGGRLYRALIVAMRASHAHTAISLIALPNEASVALHHATGWREVGVLTEAGQKPGPLDRRGLLPGSTSPD